MSIRVASVVFILLTLPLQADDNWPQWRGPNLNGSNTTARNLPVSWSETENVVWRTKMPSWSAATPIVWGDTLFVLSADRGFESSEVSEGIIDNPTNKNPVSARENILLIALNREDGSIRWQEVVGLGNRIVRKHNMSSPTPVTDGRHIWVLTGTGWLTCVDFEGKLVWQRELAKEFGDFPAAWGYGSSPLLYEGKLYVQVLHTDRKSEPYLLAVDGESGKTVWQLAGGRDAQWGSPDSYSTPTLVEVDGKKQLLVCGGGYVTAHDPETGEQLWYAGGLNPIGQRRFRSVPSLVTAGEIVFGPSRRRMPFIAFRAGGSGDVSESHRLWSTEYGPEIPTPTTDGERLYIIDDKGIALCLRVEDGTTLWGRERLEPGLYDASPLLADGKIYAISENGTTTVIEAGDEFKILSINKLGDDFVLASPIASGEQVFIRTAKYVYCIGAKTNVASSK